MKNIILASSLAVLASSHTDPKSMPARQGAKNVRDMVKAERDNIRKADAISSKSSKLAAEAVVKEEGLVLAETAGTYSDFFEISQGFVDCATTVGRVQGWEANRCMDSINTESGKGVPESEMIMKPNNDGFPIWLFFDGHGCRKENMVGHFRMPKSWMGFPPEYTTAGCMPVMMDGATTPSFHQMAMWHNMRFEPTFPAVMQGIDGKDKGCSRGKYFEYGIIAAGMCFEDDYQNASSPTTWSSFDVSNCTNGNVNENTYSDASCTTMVKSEIIEEEECVFDFTGFKEDIEEEDQGFFEYRTRKCFIGAVP